MMAARSNGLPARVLGRYELHGELAAGGMATVHLGRLRGGAGFSRTVAIKRLHPQFAKDPDFVAMFVDEARLAARIRHPNVVPTLDVVSEDGEIFLVMEYVQGESLSRLFRSLVERRERMPPHIATTLLSGVLHGLHAAHEAKSEKGTPLHIVHRDVSPQNVLVGLDGIAHVLDFGVAKAQGQAQTTRDGQLKGKIAYMAPEQLERGQVTRQSDVYAAAVVLWEMLASKRMYEADNEGAMLVKVMESRTVPPSTLVPGLPRGIDDVVMRGLARDPLQRWATARDFALALERCALVAPPSEIGEWVQSIAGDELARRSKKVSDVERGSMRAPPPTIEDATDAIIESSISGVRVGDQASQLSSISVSKSEHSMPMAAPAESRWTRLVVGALACLLLVTALFAFTLGAQNGRASTRGPATAPAANSIAPDTASAPAPQPAAAAAEAPSAVPTPPATGSAETPDPPASASVTTTANDPDPPKPATPSSAERPRRYSPPPPRPARPRADCDPPFTRDADGHKHYKLQCL